MIDNSPLRFHEFLAIINEESKLQTPDFHLRIALWLEANIYHPLLLQAFGDAGKSQDRRCA